MSALPLPVGAVAAVVPIDGGSLVKGEAEFLEHPDNGFHAAFHRPFEVGVLNAQIKDAAALMSQTLVGDGAEKVAQMHKTGGAGGHSGHFCPFRQLPDGIECLHFLRSGGHIGEEKFGKSQIVLFAHSQKLHSAADCGQDKISVPVKFLPASKSLWGPGEKADQQGRYHKF